MTAKKKKTLTAVGAVAMAAVVGLGGTFAWQSISQQALNEAAATLNPGGRLHDDFDGRNKDVYVENFTGETDGTPIFARVRLDEYMEIGKGAGSDRNLSSDEPLTVTNLTVIGQGAKINDKTTWTTRTPTSGLADEDGELYWAWDTEGGQTVYMPTFNKNKDSLKADVNGTYDGREDTEVPYDDYVTYTEGQEITADATYDADSNDIDDNGIRTEEATHTAKTTIDGTVITMEEWAERWEAYQEAVEGGASAEEAAATYEVMGDFWVWDNDGWAYWASAIEPNTATGLLLDGIELVNPPSDNYYYGINVVGQFVTADDIGHLTGTGFYDTSAGTLPSGNAEALIELMTGQDIDITRVELTARNDTDICERGDEKYFEAKVWKGNEQIRNPEIEWSIEGQLDEGTTIAVMPTKFGELTVALDEPADEVTVVAAYTGEDGETVEARMTITLTDAAVNVSITPSSEDLVPPGETLTLTAEVTRSESPLDASFVTWSISGNTDPDTTLSPSTGAETTLTVGADEARGPFTVTASYYDEKRQETKTATYAVTADVAIPLSTELSEQIREVNIEKNPAGLDGEFEDYETVKIDSRDAYVLAVDEENDRALLGIRYNDREWWLDYFMQGISHSITWAESDIRRDYLSDRVKFSPILTASAITTEIYTRNPGNIFMGTDNPKQPGVPDYGTISEDEEWIITRDKLFLFTEADIRGTDYWADPDPSNYEYGYVRYPTPNEKDFTYDGKAIIPRAILKEEAGDTFPRMTALRSPVPQSLGTTITGVSVFYQMRPGGEGNPLIDYMLSEAANGTNNFSSYYCFASVWVQLSPEA